jgi:hypothetical protein
MQTLIRPQYLLRVRFVPPILIASLIPLRKLHSGSRLQKLFKEHTGPPQSLELFNPDKQREDKVFLEWKEFYTRARAIHNKGPYGGDLGERAKEEPVDLFNNNHTTLNTIDETFEKIEKEESYNFPKDDDPTLHAACEALSHALQEASIAKEKQDTLEIKQALDNLRKAYNEAAKSNTVSMRYIDVEPPYVSTPKAGIRRHGTPDVVGVNARFIPRLIHRLDTKDLSDKSVDGKAETYIANNR